ncbi:MAG: hypothetical protein DRO11_03180, partial [Methanobacteriota archaeon]
MLRLLLLLMVVPLVLLPVQAQEWREEDNIVVVEVFYAKTCPCGVKSILRLIEQKYPGTTVVTRSLLHGPREKLEENKKIVRELGYDPEKIDFLTVVNRRRGYSFVGVEDYLPRLEALVKMAYLENADQLGKRYIRAHERLNHLRQYQKAHPGISNDINNIRVTLDQAASAARRGDRKTYEEKVAEAENHLEKLEKKLGLETREPSVTKEKINWLPSVRGASTALVAST